MTVSNTPVFPQTPNASVITIANADASNLKTVYTAGANATKIVFFNAASNDTVAHDVQFGYTISSTFYPIGTINVAASAGTASSTPPQNMLDVTKIPSLPVDNDGQHYLTLPAGATLQAKSLTTVTSGDTIYLIAFGADF